MCKLKHISVDVPPLFLLVSDEAQISGPGSAEANYFRSRISATLHRPGMRSALSRTLWCCFGIEIKLLPRGGLGSSVSSTRKEKHRLKVTFGVLTADEYKHGFKGKW
jgi:hypothetical protein